MIKKELWSEFERELFDGFVWKTEIVYYKGDLSKVDLKNDWRFKEVPKRRKEMKFLKTVMK